MTVREVVLHRDVRAPVDLSPRFLLKRYVLRRVVSAAALMAMDAAAVFGAAWLVTAIVHRTPGIAIREPSILELLVGTVITILVFLLNGLYGRRFERHSLNRILAGGMWSLVAIAMAIVLAGHMVSRSSLLAIWLLALVLAIAARSVYDAILARAYRDSELYPVILVGSSSTCLVAHGLLNAAAVRGAPPHAIGVITETSPSAEWQREHELPALGALDDLEAVLEREEPAELIVCDPALALTHMTPFIDVCRRQHVVLKLAAVDIEFGPAPVTYVAGCGVPVFVVKPPALAGIDFFAKRLLDVVVAAAGLIILSPLLLALAIAVKIDSPGPVFFVGERVGLAQRRFRCYKFRTMYRDAMERQAEMESLNEASGAVFKIHDDPRVTPVGRFMRRTSLDELPQLLNVLKGDMSLVGPRPLPLRDFDLLDDVHKQRHVVLPGITGLWQVAGRSDLSFDDMIDLDFRYIETWSIGSDLRIVGRTLAVVLGRRGAY